MRPVETRHENDCTAACLAAVLELPIESVPDFWTTKDGPAWSERVRRWLHARGWHWYYSSCDPVLQLRTLRSMPREWGNTWPPRGYWLATVSRVADLRDNEAGHLVVMHDRRPVFNPGGGLRELFRDDVWLLGHYLLVPLDPAAK